MTTTEIYERHIKPLPPTERLRLVEQIVHDMAQPAAAPDESPKRSIMELHGLGKEIWKGVDAQEYVNELRNEWDRSP